MSEKGVMIMCNLCARDYNKYNKHDKGKVHGISIVRSGTYQPVLKFVDADKSEINRHICNYCIADVVNKFGV